MESFALDYLVYTFVACFGTLQLVAWRYRLNGFLLLPSRSLSALLGVVLVGVAFLWFFGSEDRNVPADTQGVAGTEAFALFALGAALALAFTLVVSSLVNPARHREPPEYAEGVDALRKTTYFHALQASVKQLWKPRR